MRIVLIFLCAWLCWTPSLGAQGAPDEATPSAEFLLKTLRSKQVIRVEFQEEVRLPFLKQPLKSSGYLVIHPDKGFIRKVLSPAESAAAFDGNRITVTDASGTFSVDKETAPQVVSAMLLWRTLVTESEPLDRNYDVSVKTNNGEWSVTLKSRDKGAIFEKCVIRGKDNVVMTLDLDESDEVKRFIRFGVPQPASKLSNEESAMLESL